MKSKKTLIKCTALILGVLIIPLLYSYLYLGAFWNPYNSLDKLPVAVVNEDKGAVVNGQQRNLGNEMVQTMKNDKELKWIFTDSHEAESGVDGKKYYASIVIPADFSSDIASASTTDKKIAKITYSPNEKRNYLASQILNRAIVSLEEQTRSTVNKELTNELTAKLKEVPENLGTLQDGLTTLSGGAASLQSGIKSATSGGRTIADGAASLSGGLQSLSSGATTISNNLSKLSTGLDQANSGAKELSSGASGLKALSDGITSLNTGAQTLAGGLSQLLGQFTPTSTGTTLRDNVDALNAGAQSVASQFADGSDSNLKYVVNSLSDSNNGVSSYVSTVNALVAVLRGNTGIYQSVLTGLGTADASAAPGWANALVLLTDTGNATEVATTVGALTPYGITSKDIILAKQSALSQGGSAMIEAVGVLSQQFSASPSGDSTLYDGVMKIAGGTSQLDAQMKAGTDAKNPTFYDSVSLLNDGASRVASGTAQLNASLPQLTSLQEGITKLSSALDQLNSGAAQLSSGSASLAQGAATANSGAAALASGTSSLTSGLNALDSGSSQLASGLNEAKTGVGKSIDTANSELASTDGLGAYAEDPVEIKTTAVNPVSNYGEAFAPYFLSLSLWVGALITFVGIYLDPFQKIRALSRDSNRRLLRTFVFFLLGAAQAVLLAIALQLGLHLEVKNGPAFYLSCILVSFVFMSIVQFLMIFLKDVGKFLSIFMLILQLTSCGGTFPMETVPKFFNVLYPFMPMTYAVGLFKEAISGFNTANAWYNTLVLLVIFAAFACATILLSLGRLARRARLRQLEPEAE